MPRAESIGQVHLQRVPLDLRGLVRDVVEGRRAVAASRGVALTLEVPRALPLVLADPDRLAGVMDRLLGDALARVTDGGHIAVRVADRGREVVVAVVDDGPDGGLGLESIRRLVEAHGGRIWSEPTPGGGVTVSFALPSAEVG